MNEALIIKDAIDLLSDYQTACESSGLFLLDLAAALHDVIASSPYRPPQEGCLIDFLGGVNECITSKIIEKIFKYRENGHYILLESFISNFITRDIKIRSPKINAETSRFDVSVLDSTYAIVIENKLKNAPFQRNQLARYVKKLSMQYMEQNIYIIILPKCADLDIPISAKRLPFDWQKSNNNRKCAVDKYNCWCDGNEKRFSAEQRKWCSQCDKNIIRRLNDRVITLHDNFAEWLLYEADELPNHELPMKTFMMQFADFLKGLYHTRLNEKMKMTIQEFLRTKLLTGKTAQENWNHINEILSEIDQLKASVGRLKGGVCNDMVREWECILKPEYPNIQNDMNGNVYSFGINVQGIWIGCWSGAGKDNEDQPYWGIWSSKKPTKKQIKMVYSILKECEYSYDDVNTEVDNDFMVWDVTLNGVIECRNLYESAKRLGYL